MAKNPRQLQNRNRDSYKVGRSQEDRLLGPLDPQYVRIDETDEADYVAFAKKYSHLITYYNSENRPDGDWYPFFDRSAIMALIQLVDFDPAPITEKFHRLIEEIDHEEMENKELGKLERPVKMIEELIDRFEQVSISTERIKGFNGEISVLYRVNLFPIFPRIEYLAENLATAEGQGGKDWLRSLNSLSLQFKGYQAGEYSLDENKRQANSLRDYIKISVEIHSELLKLLMLIRESAVTYLEKEQKAGMVDPYIALFLGFHEVMEVAQNDLNKFIRRHRKHYFEEILYLRPKPEEPDSVHVCFELAKNVSQHSLSAGTGLTAGVDANGNPIVYQLDRDIVLNHASLVTLKAVVHDEVPPAPPVIPSLPEPVDTYFIKSKELETPVELDFDNTFSPGLAISAGIMQVDSSTSLISLRFMVNRDSFHDFEWLLRQECAKSLDMDPADDGIMYYANKLIADFFQVEYSLEGGEWYSIPQERVEVQIPFERDRKAKTHLNLQIMLEPTDPAIAANESPDFPEAIAAGHPVFRFIINEKKLHFYKVFTFLKIDAVEISVSAIGQRSLIIQNDYGMLDPNAPFQPFGPIPSVGSSFYIGHPTLFNYTLEELRLNIEWFDVPTSKDGFPGHYRDYKVLSGNDVFKVAVSILDKKEWFPTYNKQLLPLFDTVSPDREGEPPPTNRVSKIRRINEIDIKKLSLAPYADKQYASIYDNKTKRGFLRFELMTPPMAFGHKLYPEIVARVISEGMKKKKVVESPNEPYAPTIKSLTIDYSSTYTIDLVTPAPDRPEAVYHIHSFGTLAINHVIGKSAVTLLPNYWQGTHLFLGIDKYASRNSISVLFQISDDGALDYETAPELHWSYLSDGRWVTIKKEEILFDTTQGLVRSGLVGLQITGAIDRNGKILSGDLTWIRIHSSLGTQFLRNLIDIRLQAGVATFVNQDNDLEHLKFAMPAGSITDLAKVDQAISAVSQPYPSFGGRPAELEEDFSHRVSELLRHKDRAITAWDFETLVLEKFPEIRKVICMSQMDADGKNAPGQIKVVVIPRMHEDDRARGKVTRVSLGRLLQIQEYLDSRSSKFVKVHVTNVHYEYIKLVLYVKFKPGYDDITYFSNKLNEELRHLISPWFYRSDVSSGVGESIHGSKVIEFLDKRKYIDFVIDPMILHLIDDKIVSARQGESIYEVINAQSPISILISDPSHQIMVVNDAEIYNKGIGKMITEMDLRIPAQSTSEIGGGISTMRVEKDLTIPGDSEAETQKTFFMSIKWS